MSINQKSKSTPRAVRLHGKNICIHLFSLFVYYGDNSVLKVYTVEPLVREHFQDAKKVAVTGACRLFFMGVEKNGVWEGGRK